MTTYNRENPSSRYLEILGYYRQMHVHGDPEQNVPPAKMFDGKSLPQHAGVIRELISETGTKTILDYGSGKGHYYSTELESGDGTHYPNLQAYWGVEEITCYDPGYEPFAKLPEGPFNGVISTDVMEHLPEEDLSWIISEIFSFASEFVYLNICTLPAKRLLPNGENAHCTVKPPEWWVPLIDGIHVQFPHLMYLVMFLAERTQPDGQVITKKIIHRCTPLGP